MKNNKKKTSKKAIRITGVVVALIGLMMLGTWFGFNANNIKGRIFYKSVDAEVFRTIGHEYDKTENVTAKFVIDEKGYLVTSSKYYKIGKYVKGDSIKVKYSRKDPTKSIIVNDVVYNWLLFTSTAPLALGGFLLTAEISDDKKKRR